MGKSEDASERSPMRLPGCEGQKLRKRKSLVLASTFSRIVRSGSSRAIATAPIIVEKIAKNPRSLSAVFGPRMVRKLDLHEDAIFRHCGSAVEIICFEYTESARPILVLTDRRLGVDEPPPTAGH
jgi:hypothetical protein